jgi:septum site-determining protein MinD
VHTPGSPAARAYDEAARRLLGETLPVRTPRPEKQGFMTRLFGKRAAA